MSLTPVASRIALQDQAIRLTQVLQTTSNAAERRMIHQMLENICTELGIAVPPLYELGHDAPNAPDILTDFWKAIEHLRMLNIDFDHSRDVNMIAVSLIEIQMHCRKAGIELKIDTSLKKALRQSASPKFIAHKPVNSRRDRKAKSCWVFAAE